MGKPDRSGDLVGIDIRSLAAFRIGIGGLLLADLLHRAFDLRAHYTDEGVLPRGVLLSEFDTAWHVSLHNMTGSLYGQAALFGLAGVLALMLMIGYRTRLATIGSWVMFISLLNRNPVLQTAEDGVMRMLLLWSIFLPLGARWSVDAARDDGTEPPPPRIVSAATIAIMVQVALIYLVTGLLKRGDDWHDGTAIHYALHLGEFARPLASWTAGHHGLTVFLTYATLALEILGPLVIFCPWRTQRIRMVMVLAFVGFHAGLGFHMRLGLFPHIATWMWTLFLPPVFWDSRPIGWLGARLAGLRGALGKLCERLAPRRMAWRLHPGMQLVVGLLALHGLAWNLHSIPRVEGDPDALVLRIPGTSSRLALWSDPPRVRRSWQWFGHLTRMDQGWVMFAPDVRKVHGWIVVEGELEDGRLVDPRTGATPTFDRPEHAWQSYGSGRWTAYFKKIRRNETKKNRRKEYWRHREHFAAYVLRRWNATHDEKLRSVRLYYLKQTTAPPGEARSEEVRNELLWPRRRN